MKEINKSKFKEGLVVIDFFGTWCSPCSILKPTIEKLAGDYKGEVDICECDVDIYPDIATEFGIRSIPTLVFLKDGELQNRLTGIHPEETIKEAIELMISESKTLTNE